MMITARQGLREEESGLEENRKRLERRNGEEKRGTGMGRMGEEKRNGEEMRGEEKRRLKERREERSHSLTSELDVHPCF